MNIESVNFGDWPNCLKLSNHLLETIVTTDVGPRVLSLKCHERRNVFKVFDDQLGGQNEAEWRIRGGHRLWLAPEQVPLTYHIDNVPVECRQDLSSGEVVIDSIQTSPHSLRKSLSLLVSDHAPRVTVRHVIANEDSRPITAAPWALTVMSPGGLEIIPQPPLGEHPRDLLPNRKTILWPYTDLSDPRITFGQKFWLLRQSADYPPLKLGLAHQQLWIAYLLGDSLFIKIFDYDHSAAYPDGGCNFETFTDADMLEIESLGPLVSLEPGQAFTHFEDWYLFALDEEVRIESEDSLAEWLNSFLDKTHIS